MFDRFLGKQIIDVRAYGLSCSDVPDVQSYRRANVDVLENGVFELAFSDGSIFFSNDGIFDAPPRDINALTLISLRAPLNYYKGLTVQDIFLDGDEPLICFREKSPITFWIDEKYGKELHIELYEPYGLRVAVEPNTLMRCPICRGQGDLYVDPVDDCYVECRNCQASTRAYIHEEDAIKAWNAGEAYPCKKAYPKD